MLDKYHVRSLQICQIPFRSTPRRFQQSGPLALAVSAAARQAARTLDAQLKRRVTMKMTERSPPVTVPGRYQGVHRAATDGRGSVESGVASALVCSGRRVVDVSSIELHCYRERV